MPEIDNLNQITPPSVSPEFVADTRAAIEHLERNFPNSAAHMAHVARLRQSLEAAVAVQRPAPVDQRSAAQRVHDAHFGVSYTDGRVALPAVLAALVEHDAAAQLKKENVSAQFDRIGRDYAKAVETAKAVLLQTGSTVKPEQLGVHALRQLEIYGAHLKRHAASRPK
jgi:hypothetical protein